MLLPPANVAWYCIWLRMSVCLSVCVSLSVCLSVCNALIFESLYLASSFLVCWYIFRMFSSSSHIKVIGSRSRSLEQSVSVCPVQALNFACLDLERLFVVWIHSFGISRSCSYVKVVGSRSRSREQKNVSVYHVHEWSAFYWMAILFFLLGSSPDRKKFAGYYITTANEFADMIWLK